MNVFWREQPLNGNEAELYALVLKAHHASAPRGNVSGQAVRMAAVGSGDYFKAIAAGLMTLGGLHGPIEETVEFLSSPDIVGATRELVNSRANVPGWGNSFIKGKKDDLWLDVDECIGKHFPEMQSLLYQVTEELHRSGKYIYPNPSAYTAAAAIVVGIPANVSGFLLVAGRLEAWTQIASENLKAK